MILIYSHHTPIRKICCKCTSIINTVYMLILSLYFLPVLLHGSAILVPITVPRFCLSVFFSECKYVIFNTTSTKSIMVSVEKFFSFRLSSHFLNADRPSSCDMFGYNSTTSIVHKIILSGNFGRERSFFRNLLVSLL